MSLFKCLSVVLGLCVFSSEIDARGITHAPLPAKVVIGHRGAPAWMPEHTLAGYARAMDTGADLVEPDLVITKDGILVIRHENEMSGTTNVSEKPEFASRKTTKKIDGANKTGWFTEDFTLAELKTLRAKERTPANRPDNTRFDGQFEIPALQEVIDLVKAKTKETGRTIGLYIEIKHSSYFKSIHLPLEKRLAETLGANGYRGKTAPVFIQSFEVGSLKEMHQLTDLPLMQLMSVSGQPEDFRLAGDKRTYADMASAAGLLEVAHYATGIAPAKEMIIPRDAHNKLAEPTHLVKEAHAAHLLVHAYTFRPENTFLPANLRKGNVNSLTEHGDMAAEMTAFLHAGVDGFFTDDPGTGRAAMDAYLAKK